MVENIIRIAVTGPESTGKSLLSRCLAEHYNTVFVPEYSREYISKLNKPYDYYDILNIAKCQLQNELNLVSSANKLLIADTDLIVTKVWCNYKYNKCHQWILDNILKYKYDFYLLCDIDIPWQSDPLREHPFERIQLLDIYIKELTDYGFPFEIVKGLSEERINNAIKILGKNITF